ncbi:MAG TPA: hypothetical protein PKB06_00730, partial [Actinotalea sp.]|nr:hypothetical protein [Actinotalea sp.]
EPALSTVAVDPPEPADGGPGVIDPYRRRRGDDGLPVDLPPTVDLPPAVERPSPVDPGDQADPRHAGHRGHPGDPR